MNVYVMRDFHKGVQLEIAFLSKNLFRYYVSARDDCSLALSV